MFSFMHYSLFTERSISNRPMFQYFYESYIRSSEALCSICQCSEDNFSFCIATFLHRTFIDSFTHLLILWQWKLTEKLDFHELWNSKYFLGCQIFLENCMIGFQGFDIIQYYKTWLTCYHEKVLLIRLLILIT